MKGLAHPVVPLTVLLALASSCAGAPRVPEMPAWSPETTDVVAASAPRDIDDDQMRVPREVEQAKIWPSTGLYAGVALITAQPLGDFDGKSALAGPTDVVFIPDLDVGEGLGLYLSYRWHMNELLLQYSVTEHDGDSSLTPSSLDTTITYLDLNWRHYFWEKSPLQPYGLFGFGMSEAEVDDGSALQANPGITSDATFKDGININVGAGVALYTLPWVMFYGQGMYRFGRYKTSDGIDGEFSNTPDVDSDSWEVSIGAALRILPGRKHAKIQVGGPR